LRVLCPWRDTSNHECLSNSRWVTYTNPRSNCNRSEWKVQTLFQEANTVYELRRMVIMLSVRFSMISARSGRLERTYSHSKQRGPVSVWRPAGSWTRANKDPWELICFFLLEGKFLPDLFPKISRLRILYQRRVSFGHAVGESHQDILSSFLVILSGASALGTEKGQGQGVEQPRTGRLKDVVYSPSFELREDV
jgi:hypothetical protein